MPLLNLDQQFPLHRKKTRLCALLGKRGHVFAYDLWCLVGRTDPMNGTLRDMTGLELEMALEWDGNRGELVSALKTSGFLEGEDGAFRTHDWAEWQGHLKKYHEAAKTGAKSRWDKEKGAMRSASDPHCGLNAEQLHCPALPSPALNGVDGDQILWEFMGDGQGRPANPGVLGLQDWAKFASLPGGVPKRNEVAKRLYAQGVRKKIAWIGECMEGKRDPNNPWGDKRADPKPEVRGPRCFECKTPMDQNPNPCKLCGVRLCSKRMKPACDTAHFSVHQKLEKVK